MKSLKAFIARRFRWLIYAKRYFVALRAHLLPARDSYSQNGEDCEIAELLNGFDLTTGVYIDVGANQPSHISNTYRFYRQGLSGILIEPDESNLSLLKRFRSRDITIRALVGSTPKICKFNYAVFSVYNSIHSISTSNFLKAEYIPQVTVDEVVDSIKPDWVYFLSTDTEGNDLEVLRGASQTLQKTFLVCVEYHGDEKNAIEEYMESHLFSPIFDNGLNLIFRNKQWSLNR